MYNIVEKHFRISIARVRRRGGSLVNNKSMFLFILKKFPVRARITIPTLIKSYVFEREMKRVNGEFKQYVENKGRD
jgi:hypothetical protein